MEILLSVIITLVIVGALHLLTVWLKWRKPVFVLECIESDPNPPFEKREIVQISADVKLLEAYQAIYSQWAIEENENKKYRILGLSKSPKGYRDKLYNDARK